MDRAFCQTEDILHRDQSDKLVHMCDYHKAKFFHTPAHTAKMDLHRAFLLFVYHRYTFVY